MPFPFPAPRGPAPAHLGAAQQGALFTTDENVFIGAPTGSGKTVCAELALLRLWAKRDAPREVCIEPYQEIVDMRAAERSDQLASLSKVVVALTAVALTGESTADLALLRKADVVDIGLLIANELLLIGGDVGSTYEVIIFISPRSLPLEVHLQSFNVPHFPSLMLAMAKPVYLSVVEHDAGRLTICFVASRKQCKLIANHLDDQDLAEKLRYGIVYHHEAPSMLDRKLMTMQFGQGAIKDTAWSLPVTSYKVVIIDVQ
ncbi:hypothetical protein IAT38_005930 [Cryptococcus sp. DSM 104549]